MYTDAYISVAGAGDFNSLEDDYLDYVEETAHRIEDISGHRCELRLAQVRADAEAELADARKKYEDARAEADEKLADAKAQLDDGQAQVDDAESQLESAKKQIDSGENELEKNKEQLLSLIHISRASTRANSSLTEKGLVI